MTLRYFKRVEALKHCPVCNAGRTDIFCSSESAKFPFLRALFECSAEFHATSEHIVSAVACHTRSRLAARLITTEAENSPP